MKEGRFHVALGVTCCSYVNQSGVVREGLVTVSKNLKEREERGTDQVIGGGLCLPGPYGIS